MNQPTSSSSRQNYAESLETQSSRYLLVSSSLYPIHIDFMEDFHSVFNIVASSIRRFINTSRTVMWRFAEVHWIKVVCLLVMFSVIKEVRLFVFSSGLFRG